MCYVASLRSVAYIEVPIENLLLHHQNLTSIRTLHTEAQLPETHLNIAKTHGSASPPIGAAAIAETAVSYSVHTFYGFQVTRYFQEPTFVAIELSKFCPSLSMAGTSVLQKISLLLK